MLKSANSLIKTLTFGICLLALQNVFAASILPCDLKSSPSPSHIDLKLVAGKLAEPLGLVHAGDGSGRLFIVEQPGTVRILKNGKVLKKTFLDIRGRVISGGEKGLLGLAFHPNFLKNHLFFV